jgi:hypothetical protein
MVTCSDPHVDAVLVAVVVRDGRRRVRARSKVPVEFDVVAVDGHVGILPGVDANLQLKKVMLLTPAGT